MSAKKRMPAFPSPGVVLQTGAQQGAYEGMTLRDYFAAKAMQSKLVCEFPAALPDSAKGKKVSEWVAEQSYAMADAMLAEREK